MRFRTKIKLSFCVLIVIPLLTMLIIGFCISSVRIKSIEEKYDVNHVGVESIYNPTRIYSKITQNVYEKFVTMLHQNSEEIMDENMLKKTNKELNTKYSFIVIKKGDEIIFNGAKDAYQNVVPKLPNYNQSLNSETDYVSSCYFSEDYKYLVKQIVYITPDKQNGNIYIITSLEKIMPQVKRLCIEFFISIIGVVLLTATLLTIWIYKSLLKPIKKLTDATKKISQGDLDFTIDVNQKDEFGELCKDFEEMRKRLKYSAEDRLKDDEESKELISNISHDLKTPITAIKGYVEGIMDGVADTPEKMDKYIKTIYNKANDMDRLIGELTVYSKIDTNRIPYNFEKVNVDKYFSDCVDEISIDLESKNIQLNYFNYTDKESIIIADVEQMKRVINNIISNSVKYIGNKPGAVNIRINEDNGFVHIQIEDNGKGIDTKDLPFIFDRFYRTDASRNSNQGGSGIGLAIVKKIIEVHGGKIWATSKLDTGTVIHIIIRKYIEPEEVAVEQNINN